nr:reverse transcriptase domain-containing protein [Tanacetum cinerariifolium]
ARVRGFCWEGVGIHGRSSGKWWSGVRMGKNGAVRGSGKNRIMSTSTHPIIVPYDSDIKDDFSSTHSPDYISASPDYFPASPSNTSSDHLEDLSKMAPKRINICSTSHDSGIRKLVADSVVAALETQAANMANIENTNRNTIQTETHVARKCSYKEFMSSQAFNFKGTEGAVGLIRWFERSELLFSCNNYTEDCKVKFATGTLTEEALSRWNSFAQPIRIEEAYKITWSNFKKILIKKYCPRTEVKKMEDEFYNLTVKRNDLKTYIRKFQELAVLCPTMVPNSDKLMEVFIGGLPRSIEGNVTTSKPQTLEEAITITHRTFNNNSNRNNDHHQQHNGRQETFRAYAATLTENNKYDGNLPLCKKCNLHHTRPCTVKCQACNNMGHLTRNCKNKELATRSKLQPVLVTCHACREKGNFKSQCSKENNNAHERAYLLRDKNAHQDPNVVTGTFLLNQHLARVLFDLGADKSFVSISLASMLTIPPITLDTTYDIEMADGNLVGTNTIIQGCTLILLNQPFKIDLMPIKLGSFDFIIVHHQLRVRYEDIPKTAFRTRHIIDSQGIHVDPAKIEAVKNWASPTAPTEACQFLGLVGYYRRFIEDYDCEIRYHPGKANVIADALNRRNESNHFELEH